MPPRLTPRQFVDKWRDVQLKERAASQEHFIDLCRLIDHPTPAEADRLGTSFTFEAGADKQKGGHGWADVWKKGCFAWEYKGKHADLDKAYQQLLQYREALQNPPLLIVSDIERIVIHTNFTNTVKRVTTISLDDLLTADGLNTLRAAFENPDHFRVAQTTEQVTEKAAAEFARLAELLRRYGIEPLRAAHFLIRVLFCLFAEDVGLLPNRLFMRLLEQGRRRPAIFTQQLSQLFGVMASGGLFGLEEVLQFNGRLFDDAAVLELDSDGLEILARVSTLDWSNIEPSIFGTLFVRGLDPSQRAQLGAQYTSKSDILLIVGPVLMAPLRRRWAEVQAEARGLAQQRDKAAGKKHSNLEKQLRDLLIGFAAELARIQVLDPACGSGNFLYVSLLLLLDLWKELSNLMTELGFPRLMPMPDVSPSPGQLHGIEINEYARELAQTTIWIGYIQWFVQNGFGFPSEPILKPIDTILRMDAILANHESGKPTEPEWPLADVIVGNPPFLGDKKMRAELGDKYVDALRSLYGERIPGQSDLVCYWFEKARAMLALGKVKRAGLLATNSIRGGANRTVLERIKETGDIFWAMSDRDWILDGAAVNVSMVGFDDGAEQSRSLDNHPAATIAADLTTTLDLTVAKGLQENFNISFVGPSPHGSFDIDADRAKVMLSAPMNPNGRSNSDVVRPVVSAIDLVQRPRHMWTIDFALLPMQEAAKYEMPFEYVKKHVYPVRAKNRRAAYAEKWWQYAEARPGMREALKGKSRFIVTPRVAKHRVFVWITSDVLANDGTIVFASESDYVFGMLHSKPHELWALRMGTSLEDRPRYTPTTTFETFAFPWPPGKEPKGDPRVEAIASAARNVVMLRETQGKGRTLTQLYNERPTWLDLAHKRLDEAVFDAYGWPHDLSDEEILARLLALNLERAAA
ncbi:MAG TPA: DNA methyltransferase [Anaerolineae bacterium]|nr:DNA methyltransferase [Anaerolineae bacterium]